MNFNDNLKESERLLKHASALNMDTSKLFGHPSGLFVLFFTEMWERFSYYGMRALLVLFLISPSGIGGWDWSRSDALKIYGLYTGLVYLTPIIGGFVADKLIGFRKAILLGAFLMTLGHVAMAFETNLFFYIGLILLILGNGFFKPNISSIVGGLYPKESKKKDPAYTIFYMGINAGAFLGILLCGYIGEKEGWSLGFGLAGIFMFLGMIQFYFAQGIFGKIGLTPKKENKTSIDKEDEDTPKKVKNDRLIVIGVLSVFTIFFWMAFEQAGGSMTVFAKDYTNRILTGGGARSFAIINALLAIVPLAVITYVLLKLFGKTFKNYLGSNIALGLSFLVIWGVVIWMINKDFKTKAYEVSYQAVEVIELDENGNPLKDDQDEILKVWTAISEGTKVGPSQKVEERTAVVRTDEEVSIGSQLFIMDKDKKGSYIYLPESKAENIGDSKIKASFTKELTNEIEVPASWFSVLNSLFIIIFAPIFSWLWARWNASAPVKFALGLALLGVGFGVLAFGAMPIKSGASVASVSMVWLIFAYLFHTLGELAISPVGLSYVSKLSPLKLVSLMFGVWFTCSAIGNFLAGMSGSLIDKISEAFSLSGFFLVFTVLPILIAVIALLLNKTLVKKMHGIK